ncbi:MAG: DUF4386 family protein [Ferruginibacter sp.]
MNDPHSELRNLHLLRLAGITAIAGGLLIPIFAAISGSQGVFFVPEIYTNGSVEYWIQNLGAHKGLVKWSMILFIFGFSCIILTGFILFKVLPKNSWQKYLSVMAYAVGGIIILPMMAFHQSTINYINSIAAAGEFTTAQIQQLTGAEIYRWMLINQYFGPLFVVVLGTGLMAWAMLKTRLIPKWFCYIAFTISGLLLLSFFNDFIPDLSVLGNAAPLHMIWFVILGIFLLKFKKTAT